MLFVFHMLGKIKPYITRIDYTHIDNCNALVTQNAQIRHTNTPYLAFTGELYGVYWDYFRYNWSYYKCDHATCNLLPLVYKQNNSCGSIIAWLRHYNIINFFLNETQWCTVIGMYSTHNVDFNKAMNKSSQIASFPQTSSYSLCLTFLSGAYDANGLLVPAHTRSGLIDLGLTTPGLPGYQPNNQWLPKRNSVIHAETHSYILRTEFIGSDDGT